MSEFFTPEEEERVREIAIEVAIAASRAQAQTASLEQIDRLTIRPDAVRAFLGGEPLRHA